MPDHTQRLCMVMLGPSPDQAGGVNEFFRLVFNQLAARHEMHAAHVGRDGGTLPTPMRMARDMWRLARLLVRVRPDVVMLNPSMNRALLRELLNLLLVKLLHRGVVVVFNHGWSSTWPARIANSAALAALARRVCHSIDRLYVLSARARSDVLSWGVPGQRVLTTTTLCDVQAFEAVHRQRPLANGKSDGAAQQVLFLSRLVPGKGAETLVHAAGLLAAQFPRVRWVLAGDGAARAEAVALAQRVAPLCDIKFPGHVSGRAKAQLMCDSDLYVFPSQLAEGLPISLLEAMAAGLPVLASSVGGIADLFASGTQGEAFAAPPDVQTLKDALARWLGDPDRMQRAGASNKTLALDRFSAGSWCSRLEMDLQGLLAAKLPVQARPGV
jgi:glycosyltransferase involved in cell wall biosynthesis